MQHVDGKLSICLAVGQPSFTSRIKDTKYIDTKKTTRDSSLKFVIHHTNKMLRLDWMNEKLQFWFFMLLQHSYDL